jgi:hypothetical protein
MTSCGVVVSNKKSAAMMVEIDEDEFLDDDIKELLRKT